MMASNDRIVLDEAQARLARELEELGYALAEPQSRSDLEIITPVEAARAVLSVVRRRPDLAAPDRQPLLGPLRSQVFGEALSAEQVVRAVKVFRRAREHLSRLPEAPRFAPHAAPLVAMLVSDELHLLPTGHEPDELEDLDGLDERIATYSLLDRAVLRVRLLLALAGIDDRDAPRARLVAAFAGPWLASRAATADREGMRITEQVIECVALARSSATDRDPAGSPDEADTSDVDPLALLIADTMMQLGAMPGPSEPD